MERTCTQRQFDPHNTKYFCCCGCHVMTGAKIIASIYSLLLGLDIMVTARSMLSEGGWINATGIIIGTAICVTIFGCLWHGILHERAGHLIPFMVITMFNIGSSVLALVMCLILIFAYSAASDSYRGYQYSSYIDGQSLAIVFVVLIGMIWLHIWIFLIMKKAYSFLLHKRFSTVYRCANAPHTYQGYVAVPKEDTPPPAYEGQKGFWKEPIENVI
uniref:Uncharacterized protein n=1 Tax=Plectus sambesii TaxID=2011161 RepID=A0A914UQL4_9BILA